MPPIAFYASNGNQWNLHAHIRHLMSSHKCCTRVFSIVCWHKMPSIWCVCVRVYVCTVVWEWEATYLKLRVNNAVWKSSSNHRCNKHTNILRQRCPHTHVGHLTVWYTLACLLVFPHPFVSRVVWVKKETNKTHRRLRRETRGSLSCNCLKYRTKLSAHNDVDKCVGSDVGST